MHDAIRLIDLGCAPWWQTQALYHAVATTMRSETSDTIILCRPDRPYVCVGYHQRIDEVLDLQALQRLRLPLVRRRLGGGATYLDGDQIFYQLVFHRSRLPLHIETIFSRLLQPAVLTLRSLGLPAVLRRTNEIEVEGRRVAGTGGGQIGEAGVVVGNFLFGFDYDRMIQLWHVPDEDFRDLAAQALRTQLAPLTRWSVQEAYSQVVSIFCDAVEQVFERPVVVAEPTEKENRRAERLRDQLLVSIPDRRRLQWCRVQPQRSLKIAADDFIHARCIELHDEMLQGSFWVKNGRIRASRIRDMRGRRRRRLEKKLQGQSWKIWQANSETICAIPS